MSLPPYALECDSKRINHVTLYAPKLSLQSSSGKKRIKGIHFVFLALYVYQVYWCLSTVGQPYREFLEKADRDGFAVMEGTTRMRAELEHALSDISNPDRPKEKLGWFDWMEMDIEEHAAQKKREKEQSVLDSLPKKMRVPSKTAMAFWPMLISGMIATLHALVMLLQHWSVGFNAMLNYNVVDASTVEIPDEADLEGGDNDEINELSTDPIPIPAHSNLPTHARISPAKGKDMLIPLSYLPTLGITFEYHRRRYVYSDGSWTKIRCRTDMPVSFFETWSGFESPAQIRAVAMRFGKNIFDVKQPSFVELYKAQLLSPFTVFQLFCVILWMLDDYWQYSFFTLFMILMFEATVVFSRIKSLSALRGMGNKNKMIMVYRLQRWTKIDTHDLMPGDIVSVTRHTKHHKKTDDDDKDKESPVGSNDKAKSDSNEDDDQGDIVPCDVLLLRGACVVSEASLTGESVPQMKEGLSDLAENDNLAMKGKHKSHILYAGTKMLQCKGAPDVSTSNDNDKEGADLATHLYSSIPPPPDKGCVCFTLRTGFSSAQGKLVRMIEGSQEKVKGHEKETGLLLLLLFCFAVASSSYVLYKGMQDDNRSQYELLLHCILIITSVIPPELPMQMALAVNSSLMTLMKMQVFCTEPYRVPIAGKLDVCLFDKTGTLTTDELVAVGICTNTRSSAKKETSKSSSEGDTSSSSSKKSDLTPMTKTNNEAGLVLAGCHTLVLVDDDTAGDPLEAASLDAMGWRVDANGRSFPKTATEKKTGGKPFQVAGMAVSHVDILARHHFNSKLQRMSCVVKDNNRRVYAVAKGSPEMIGNLIVEKPTGYDVKSKELAKRGYRVIALAYKLLKTEEESEAIASRNSCEERLHFAGFIAFTCRVRRDTKFIINKLREGGMSVIMVTGDALLTAAHVAKETAICDTASDDDDPYAHIKNDLLKNLLQKTEKKIKKKKTNRKEKKLLILEAKENKLGHGLYWQSYDDESHVADFEVDNIPLLAETYDLATTGKNLAIALESDEKFKSVLGHFKIFARMTPDAKETVIECLHTVDNLCLMCGDGANDVGALKQADVGVALMSGFGDVNVDRGDDSQKKKKSTITSTDQQTTAIFTQEAMDNLKRMPVRLIKLKLTAMGVNLNDYPSIVEKDDIIQLYRLKSIDIAVKKHEQKNAMDKLKMSKTEAKSKSKEDMAAKQQRMMERVKELEAQGVQWAQFKAMKEFWAEEMAAGKKKKAELAKSRSIEGSAASMVAQIEDLEMDELPMVKLGDASIAAPFTSKMPSIKSCVDIIRQGRCTLVTSIQMYQIMALNCLISAYSLSVLYLDGVKYGDIQMTAMGILMSVSFMSVSRSKPLDKLSAVQPLTSIFHPSLFLSLLGQFSVHLITMILAVRSAKKHLPPDFQVDLDGEFKPGIVNSVVFLVSNVQQVTVFVVNLQGRPFMNGITENRPLLWSLVATFILTFMFASESIPGLNKYFQLVPFPDEAFRDFILTILVADVTVCFAFDRIMKFIFCPKILFASMEGTTANDVFKLARTFGIIMFIMYIFLANDEQWEEMLKEEGRFDDEGILNGTNITGDDGIVDTIADCVGAACEAAADAVNDIFEGGEEL